MTTTKKATTKRAAPKKKTPVKKRAVRKKTARKKARHGGARKGAGRPKGTATQRTRAIADKLAKEAGITPLEYMLTVLNEGPEQIKERFDAGDIEEAEYLILLKAHIERRDWAAEKAAPYIHPRLASVQLDQNAAEHEAWVDELAD